MIKQQLLLISIGYLMISFFIILLFNGTGGEADSIHHYLYAKYAPNHPELFLNHWAKPLFTLLISPFAQVGFIGAKTFNVLAGLVSVIFSFKIATQLKLKNAFLGPLFFFIFPISFTTTFSGFTEPLFAAMLTMSIYLCLKERLLLAAFIVSFLPFVRSEGLIFILLFGFFFVYKKSFKSVLLLVTGHLFYSIIGFAYYHDFLWVINRIPYASLNSHYGSGEWMHFAEQIIYLTGVPLLLLFLLGIVKSVLPQQLQHIKQLTPFRILIIGGILSFFIAHTLFWGLGIFNSMGLKRVFAAISPLMAICCLYGFNTIELIPAKGIKIFIKISSMLYILIFPFSSNPAAVNWQKDLMLTDAQLAAIEVSSWIQANTIAQNRFIYTDPYLGESLQVDPFDTSKRLILSPQVIYELKAGDVIIWENWHAVVDYGLPLASLKTNSTLAEIHSFQKGKSRFVVFQKKRD